jgi:hypothetical protein
VWILVLNPPHETADRLVFEVFLGARAVVMGTYDRAVDHCTFVVGIGGEVLEYPRPHARLGPAAETTVDIDRVAEALRQVTPGNAGPVAGKHRFDEQAVVGGGHPDRAASPRQKVLNPFPLVVTQSVAAHRSAL